MSRVIKVGSDFSGVGAFNQALMRLGIEFDELFACDMDKYARQTFVHNYGEPKYYPENVYDRQIPLESLDIFMTSPPCQAFSLAGKRLGKDDKRGILFFNSHEFIQENKPRFFIFENVKGLISDDFGKTFSEWINMLGGKSVNGLPIIFPYEDSVPYHIYWKVLNAKDFNIPQNRERVFIIGIRDDEDNIFQFPKEVTLQKRLKDVLEENVPEKYFLSDKAINGFVEHTKRQQDKGNGFKFDPNYGDNIASSVLTRAGSRPDDNFIKVKSATKSGYEIETENDSINFSVPNSETRRGMVGKGVCQTLDTACNQAVMVSKEVRTEEAKKQRKETGSNNFRNKEIEFRNQEFSNAITTQLTNDHFLKSNYRIRRLTPRECFRLMDFPDSFSFPVSDSQAYKQAGNSICVGVLAAIINQLKKL
jgi:DNA (cytosine-5)-methyltransferase 1